MKEAFWGIFIILLGSIGIVAINLFQSLTVSTDQNYYLMKEVTKAAMADSVDISYYRALGKPRIVKDAFVENLTRRFASSVILNSDYKIVIHDIVEQPPKVSLSLLSNTTDLQGEKYNILLNVDSVYEGMYGSDVLFDESLIKYPFPVDPIPTNQNPYDDVDGKCPNSEVGINECISGDLQFVKWGDISAINQAICPEDIPGIKSKLRDAIYKECDCGKWSEEITESVNSVLVRTPQKVTHEWVFVKDGPVNDIDTKSKQEVSAGICTSGLQILIKDDPLYTVTGGVVCPPEGITIVVGQTQRIFPRYIPKNSINRDLKWTKSSNSVTLVEKVGAITYPEKDYVDVIGTDAGDVVITATSSNNKSASCNVKVIDLDDFTCPDQPITVVSGSVAYATSKLGFKTPNMTYSITNENIATIDSVTGEIKAASNLSAESNIKYSISIPNKTITCDLKVLPQGEPIILPPVGSNSCRVGDISLSRTIKTENSVPKCYYKTNLNKFISEALRGSELSLNYCSKNTPFVSCANGIWDSSGTIPLNNSSGPNYIVSTNVTKYNETTKSYTISYTATINNNGWQPDLINKSCRSKSVVQSYSGTISGKLTDDTCVSSPDNLHNRNVLISNCPNVLLKDNVVSTGIELEPPSSGIDSYTWSLTDSSVASFVGSSKNVPSIKLKGLKPGTTTLKIEVTNSDFTSSKTSECLITVPEDPCSTVLKINPGRTCLIAGIPKEFSVGSGYSNIFGNSNWKTDNALIYTGSTTSNTISVTGINSAPTPRIGKLSYQTQYICNGVQKEVTRYLDIYSNPDYFCLNPFYNGLSGDKCYASAGVYQTLTNKNPTCNPDTEIEYNNFCYTTSTLQKSIVVDPSCEDGWELIGGWCTKDRTTSYTSTTTNYQDCPKGKSCSKTTSTKICKDRGFDAPCYSLTTTTTKYTCPVGSSYTLPGGVIKCVLIPTAGYTHCDKGYETGTLVNDGKNCIYSSNSPTPAKYCSGVYGSVPYYYNSSVKKCVLAVAANVVECKG